MSMVINLVEDHNIYLCEGGPVYNGGTQPTPITYITQWKIVGNSEVHGTEIWSCGEYNPMDGKWHILVQPLGGSIADIALDEPLRKVNSVADSIEFPSETEGKALVTRPLKSILIGDTNPQYSLTEISGKVRWKIANDAKDVSSSLISGNVLSSKYPTITSYDQYKNLDGVCIHNSGNLVIVYDELYSAQTDADAFKAANADTEVIYELATPITELVDAPQIEEAESYSMVISQGSKAVEWSSFETE